MLSSKPMFFSITSLKKGEGKTTLTKEIAYALANSLGKKLSVCVVDCNSDGNLSDICGISKLPDMSPLIKDEAITPLAEMNKNIKRSHYYRFSVLNPKIKDRSAIEKILDKSLFPDYDIVIFDTNHFSQDQDSYIFKKMDKILISTTSLFDLISSSLTNSFEITKDMYILLNKVPVENIESQKNDNTFDTLANKPLIIPNDDRLTAYSSKLKPLFMSGNSEEYTMAIVDIANTLYPELYSSEDIKTIYNLMIVPDIEQTIKTWENNGKLDELLEYVSSKYLNSSMNNNKLLELNATPHGTFKDNLKMLRRISGISQSALGESINVSQQAICKYENGTAEPNLETLIKISHFFLVPLNQLLGMERISNKDDSDNSFLNKFNALPATRKHIVNTIVDDYYTDISKKISKNTQTQSFTRITVDSKKD